MSQNSKIEWTGSTWNPLAGCTAKSPGCLNCYAATMSGRLEAMGQAKYTGVTIQRGKRKVFTGRINYDENALLEPLRKKKPTTYFVNSMSDLFWGDEDDLATAARLGVADPQPVPFEFIDKVFAVMALTPQHIFQILTKRPGRMAQYFNVEDLRTRWANAISGEMIVMMSKLLASATSVGSFGPMIDVLVLSLADIRDTFFSKWPLPNVWLGVSVEDQKTADERIPLLLNTPAAIRWLSIEPLLSRIDLTRLYGRITVNNSVDVVLNGLSGQYCPAFAGRRTNFVHSDRHTASISWAVIGGESGPASRPFYLKYAVSLVEQCRAAKVACFVKQLGAMPIGADGLTWHGLRDPPVEGQPFKTRDRKGGDLAEFPVELQVREMPEVSL